MIAFFKSEDYQANPDHVRFLVWRNKTAAVLNNHVRTQLWGKDVADYVPGDRLIAKMPVFRPNPHKTSQKNQWQIVINNSEECEVIGKATINELKTVELTKGTENDIQFYTVKATGECGMSRNGLAKLAGVSGQALSKLEFTLATKAPSRRVQAYFLFNSEL